MTAASDTRVRERTRQAILRAGIDVLVEKPTAALVDVADRAGVARSTLHRYFADRDALLAAIEDFVGAEYGRAVTAARIDEGSGREAYERLVGELLDRTAVFAWWLRSAAQDDDYDEEFDRSAVELVTRGQRDGSIDPGFDPQWIVTTVWSLLFSVQSEIGRGRRTARELRDMCFRVLLKLVAV